MTHKTQTARARARPPVVRARPHLQRERTAPPNAPGPGTSPGPTYMAKIYPEREPEDCRWSILELLTLDTAIRVKFSQIEADRSKRAFRSCLV